MKKEQRKEREYHMRREAILAEAEKIFSARGFHHVTVADIARASGFSTGALYQFFKSKEDLYTSMILGKMSLMYNSIRERVESERRLEEKLAALIDAQLSFVEQNTDFCRIFLRGENELSPETMEALRKNLIEYYFDYLSFIEKILKAGIKQGKIRALPSREIAAAFSHLVRAAAIEWMLLPAKESLLSKKDMILDIFLNGVNKHDR